MPNHLFKRKQKSLKKLFEHKGQYEERKAQKKERQTQRAQRAGRPPRRRDWDEDGGDTVSRETIRSARAEEPRASGSGPAPSIEGPLATVLEVHGADAVVSLEGRTLRAGLPAARLEADGQRGALAVGDRVQIEPVAAGDLRIVAIAPRRSSLARDVYDADRDAAFTRAHVLAANIDDVVIVCSPAEPPFRPRLLDRYLVAASREGLPVTVCLNKCDLGVGPEVEVELDGYARLGITVLRTSATSGSGIDELQRAIEGRVALFSGHSGVGKSSLLNALEPGLALKVGRVTEATAGQGKGRHTTSSARLVPLSIPETYVVDTPGIRAFGIRGMTPRELASHFADIAPLVDGCAYRDCRHAREPGCAVEAAAQGDPFLRRRLGSYRALLRELT